MRSARVVIVDDYEQILSRLRKVLVDAGHEVSTYSSATEFLASALPEPPCCVLLDVDMPGVSGLEAQRNLLRMSSAVPVVFMTGLRDVPTTIEAFKNGASDFLLKPFSNEVLLSAVERAVQRGVELQAQRDAVDRARARLASLTPRERDVCLLVSEGLTSREIATKLGMAESTVSLHRAHLMTKLEAGSVAEVVRLVDLARATSPA
jgi:FixJ family two-component response regulator